MHMYVDIDVICALFCIVFKTFVSVCPAYAPLSANFGNLIVCLGSCPRMLSSWVTLGVFVELLGVTF